MLALLRRRAAGDEEEASVWSEDPNPHPNPNPNPNPHPDPSPNRNPHPNPNPNPDPDPDSNQASVWYEDHERIAHRPAQWLRRHVSCVLPQV